MEPIAIIGMGCRFPKAENPEEYWRLLLDGGDAITEIPSSRWNLDEFYDDNPETPGKMNSRWGGFLENIDQFDADFFRISPREARLMDPQQRLLLEVTWEALEDAGAAADRLSGARVGVFIGIMNTEFGHLHLPKHGLVNAMLGAGSSAGIAANRLSYFFNFHGPSLVVDTLCSSSLVAVHLACQSIWNGESTPLAIAGGVNVILLPTMNIFYAKSGLAAPDGRCKTFDARANGIVRGEGVGIVVLKPLKLALEDGDPIYCVIRGSAVNQDGRTNGLTSPNRWAQIALLEDVYKRAGISPGRVQYVEAHGTGTPIGDPIEMKALGTVLATDRPAENRCSVGSVKTNIGHLESAAGIASLIKTALVLKHRTLVGNLHFESPNPYIPFDELPLRAQESVEPWPPDSSSIVAGVSSFGLGGTNAHVVLESYQLPTQIERHQECVSDEPHLLALSARSADALRAVARSYQKFLLAEEASPTLNLRDLCYTSGVRRSHHDYRLAILARSMSEVEEQLSLFVGERSDPELFKRANVALNPPGLAFVFAGQGSQWIGMGLELLEKEPVFRRTIERCDDLLSRHARWSLINELRADREHSRLHETENAQPAIFAVQAGLASLWSSWGINPDVVIGHSVGEVAAAYVAGVLSLEDAITVIFHRGRLTQRAHGRGKMLAAKISSERLQQLLADYEQRISVAAVNGPNSFTLSGDPAVIEGLLDSLPGYDAVGRMLQGEYAFHSQQMEPLQEELTTALSGTSPNAAKTRIFSTLTGQFSDGHEFIPSYWAKQIREPVLFAPVINQLIENGFRHFVEISPDPVLVGAVNQCLRHRGLQGFVLPSLKRRAEARVTMLSSLGALYTQGFNINWGALYAEKGRSVSLPAYPWQKERHWLDDRTSDASDSTEPSDTGRHIETPEEEESISDWLNELTWQPAKQQEVYSSSVSDSADRPGGWLIFSDQVGVGEKLREFLRQRGESSVIVFQGDSYRCLGPGQYQVNGSKPEDFRRLLDECCDSNRNPCRQVVHLWSFDGAMTKETTLSTLKEAQRSGCISVLHFVQALDKAGWRLTPRLWLVTRKAQAVEDDRGAVEIAQSTLWGLGKTISQELPQLRCTMVDLGGDSPSDDAETIFRELTAPDEQSQIAWRKRQRYTARLTRFRTRQGDNSAAQDTDRERGMLRQDSTYLITGGLGALGLRVAQWMVESGVRYLALLGRNEPSATAQEELARMRLAGARIQVIRADASNEEQVAEALARIGREMPVLRGIIHAAGVLNDGALLRAEQDTFIKVMEPKILGAWNLHRQTSNLPLDFFVMFSSLASVLGSKGQGNYAAANAFLDALSHHRSHLGLPAMSINWGPWSEIGMAAGLGQRMAMAGLNSLTPEEGIEVLDRLLRERFTQVAVIPSNGIQSSELNPIYTATDFAGSEDLSALHSFIRQLEEAPLGERWSLLVTHIQAEAGNVLGYPDSRAVDTNRNLFEIGMDSLMAVELGSSIQKSLEQNFSLSIVFEHPSIEKLACALVRDVLPLEIICQSQN